MNGMMYQLDELHLEKRKAFEKFSREEIKPLVPAYDAEEVFPAALIEKMAAQGYLGAVIPQHYGGRGWDQLTLALLHEEIGAVCSSARSLLTVHSALVAETLVRWGTAEQKAIWLPLLATGEKIAAFCLTEATSGSDAKNMQATYTPKGGGYCLNGTKKWVTFGEIADVYLFFARDDKGISAFMVERETPGVEVMPVKGLLGIRASMAADVRLNDCLVSAGNLVGRKDMGFLQIANTALDNGRFSVALGSLGIAKACLQDSIAYAQTREQFGSYLKDHQLIKQKIANMITEVKAATLLCYNAACLRDARNPNSIIQTTLAKYYAARVANRNAADAVQIHGAKGCQQGLPVERYFRDAKIMEIIEGTAEIQQILIADHGIAALANLLNH